MIRKLMRTAREVKMCSDAWEDDACLIGNARADEIRAVMDDYIALKTLVRRLRNGGMIVSTGDLSEVAIAKADACYRMYVDEDALGYAYIGSLKLSDQVGLFVKRDNTIHNPPPEDEAPVDAVTPRPTRPTCELRKVLEMNGSRRIYLAGRYSRREELLRIGKQLKGMGHEVTSRWLLGKHEMKDERPGHEEAMMFAEEDIQDILKADVLVAFTEEPGAQKGRARGGRHVEFGYAIARGMRVCVVGHRENVFCHLPEVMHFDSTERFMSWARRRKGIVCQAS